MSSTVAMSGKPRKVRLGKCGRSIHEERGERKRRRLFSHGWNTDETQIRRGEVNACGVLVAPGLFATELHFMTHMVLTRLSYQRHSSTFFADPTLALALYPVFIRG